MLRYQLYKQQVLKELEKEKINIDWYYQRSLLLILPLFGI